MEIAPRHTQESFLSFFNEALYALGFAKGIGKKLTAAHECTEAFIDSTYKINSSKRELFAVLTTVFGTGFPSAYVSGELLRVVMRQLCQGKMLSLVF